MGWPGPVTHRQFAAWQEWLDDQWNNPDRADHYVMEVTAAVERVLSSNPGKVKPRKLKFAAEAGPGESFEAANTKAHLTWAAILGVPVPGGVLESYRKTLAGGVEGGG